MRTANATPILLEALLPRATLAKNLLLVAGGSLLVALCAQIAVPLPFSPVPVTGQTFAVLLLGATFGAWRAAAALILYLLEGVAGLPVFAPIGAPGLARLAGPTAGYLLAYPVAAFLLGKLLEVTARRKVLYWLAGMLAAEAVILGSGALWLKWVTRSSWPDAVRLGALPFLPGELFKVALVGICLPASWWAAERYRRS